MDCNDQEDVDNYSFLEIQMKNQWSERRRLFKKQASKRLKNLLALYRFLYLVRGSCRALLKPTWFIIFENTKNTMLVTEGSFKGWPCRYAKLRQYYIFAHIRANMCIYVQRASMCIAKKWGMVSPSSFWNLPHLRIWWSGWWKVGEGKKRAEEWTQTILPVCNLCPDIALAVKRYVYSLSIY